MSTLHSLPDCRPLSTIVCVPGNIRLLRALHHILEMVGRRCYSGILVVAQLQYHSRVARLPPRFSGTVTSGLRASVLYDVCPWIHMMRVRFVFR